MGRSYTVEYDDEGIFVKYTPYDGIKWILDWYNSDSEERKVFCKIFNLSRKDFVNYNEVDDGDYGSESSVIFKIGNKETEGYVIRPPIINEQYTLTIREDSLIDESFFSGIYKARAMNVLFDVIGDNIIIGNSDGEVSKELLSCALSKYPTNVEVTHYVEQRMAAILSTEIELKKDYSRSYELYLKKRQSDKKIENIPDVLEYDIEKYSFLLKRMKDMLADCNNYSEADWQTTIVDILCVLFPQYIIATREVELTELFGNGKRVDYVLINNMGYVDLMEIKHPNVQLLAKRKSRNNIVASRKLSDSVTQVENYLFSMNRDVVKSIEKITKKISGLLPDGMKINILNPHGLVIMGYSSVGWNKEESEAIELLRRQYSHITDVITYNDLIERLENTIVRFTMTKKDR